MDHSSQVTNDNEFVVAPAFLATQTQVLIQVIREYICFSFIALYLVDFLVIRITVLQGFS